MDARTWTSARSASHRQPLVLLGLGGVGRALLKQILDARQLHERRYGLRLQVVAVADSLGLLMADELDDDRLSEALEVKESGGSVGELEGARDVSDKWLEQRNPLVADTTATDAVTPSLIETLRRGGGVALANKKPLTGSWKDFQALSTYPARARWESTVGSGLPVNATLARIVASGDHVTRITGTISGTLGFLMSGLEQGRTFSDLVCEAHRKGYTEPDPREDLGGLDVARKALILARTLGWKLEMKDVEVKGLYPHGELDKLEATEFLSRIAELDEGFSERVRRAAESGSSLRYAARVEDGRCSVGPADVPSDSPLGRLRGNDNLIEFTTGFFQPNPLVIQGRGAGVAATAAGVLADLVELSLAMRQE